MTPKDLLRDVKSSLDSLLHPHLRRSMDIEGTMVPSAAGDLFLYEDTLGEGTPVVLVHSVNAAASSYEMRPIFEALRGKRPVLAFDLPGFGRSQRGERIYDRALYRRAVTAMVERMAKHRGGFVHVVALSLGCEFAGAAAIERPELVRSLALISPTGLGSKRPVLQQQAADGRPEKIEKVLDFPLVGPAVYAAVTSWPSVLYFLSRSFVGPVDKELARYGHASAHQWGGRFAPLAFLSGALFHPEAMSQIYEKVTCPTVVLYDRDAYTDFAELPEILRRPGWSAIRVGPSRGLPQFERTEQTMAALRSFWAPLDAEDARMDQAEALQPGF